MPDTMLARGERRSACRKCGAPLAAAAGPSPADLDRQAQEAWEDEELLPIMTDDSRRWWLARRARKGGERGSE